MRIVVLARIALTGFVLLPCTASPCALASETKKQAPPPSTKMIAFDSDEPDAAPSATPAPAAATPDKVDPRRPAEAVKPRTVYYGRVIPTPPNVTVREPVRRPLGAPRTPVFTSRPASATALAINSRYGIRYDPITGFARMHTGVDLQAIFGDAVGASMSGTVIYAGRRGGYGNCVIIDHGSGVSTYYAHLSSIAVEAGQAVEAGEYIGQVGSTGRSTGPHLHYEVRANGHPIEPATLITIDEGALYASGRKIADPVDPLSDAALPLAPGGTTIAVQWNGGDGAKPSEHALAIEFE
jgi:murein DD-endopeptidase MepM/ murein hydrolase activator NlpD